MSAAAARASGLLSAEASRARWRKGASEGSRQRSGDKAAAAAEAEAAAAALGVEGAAASAPAGAAAASAAFFFSPAALASSETARKAPSLFAADGSEVDAACAGVSKGPAGGRATAAAAAAGSSVASAEAAAPPLQPLASDARPAAAPRRLGLGTSGAKRISSRKSMESLSEAPAGSVTGSVWCFFFVVVREVEVVVEFC